MSKDNFIMPTTGIIERAEGFEPYFKIDIQTFYLKEVKTMEEAEWYTKMLTIAFMKLNPEEAIKEAYYKGYYDGANDIIPSC
jgi:hypothetical protein